MDLDVESALRTSESTPMEALARWGLASRGFLYVLLGLLVASIAFGQTGQEGDQQGALALLGTSTWGKVLLALAALGFFAYAVWRLSEAAFGVAGDPGTVPRLQSAVITISYTVLGVSTVRVLLASGRHQRQAQQQRAYSSTLLQHTGGRLLLGVIGLVVLVVGAFMVSDGVRKQFCKVLRLQDMSGPVRRVVELAGMVGTVARGLVFALVGGLVVQAALTRDVKRAGGLDDALRTLAGQPYGQVLLLAAALGFLTFGAFGFAEARWHKT